MLPLFPADVDRRLVRDDYENSSYGSEEDSVYRGSANDDGDVDSSISDCESVVSGCRTVEVSKMKPEVGANGLIRLDKSDKMHEIIDKKFISRLNVQGVDAQVECIHRNLFNASSIALARLRSFQIFTKAVENINGGNANIKYAWFGASKDQIDNIILHGFSHDNIKKDGPFGYSVVLSADHSPLESVNSATLDDSGARHILLCRVLLGKSEVVNHCSTQCHPSSDDFQSGVDDLVSPKKFIVWSTQMNTQILPEFVISFKTLSGLNGPRTDQVHLDKPVSPWIPIPALITALSKILPPEAMKGITRYRRNFIEHKISRRDMIQGIREFSGDALLISVLKEFRDQRRIGQTGKSGLGSRFSGV